MDIYGLRQRNVQKIITDFFGGNASAFAARVDRQPSYIHRCLTTGKDQKNIGEKIARDFERLLGLEKGALDREEGGVVLPQATPGKVSKDEASVLAMYGRLNKNDQQMIRKLMMRLGQEE